MLRLMQERDELHVVADQSGKTTSCSTLSKLLLLIASQPDQSGIYHWCDGGEISWYDFALAIQAEATAMDLLDKRTLINPITTEQYPTPASRPTYSVLNRSKTLEDFDFPASDWRAELNLIIRQLAESAKDQP